MSRVPSEQLWKALGLEEGCGVTVWKPEMEKFYHVLFKHGGKQYNRSTGCEDVAAAKLRGAEIFAEVVAAPRKAAEAATLATLAERLARIEALLASLGAGASGAAVVPSSPRTPREAVEEYLGEKGRSVSPLHLKNLRMVNGELVGWLEREGKELHQLGVVDLSSWLHAMEDRVGGWKAKTHAHWVTEVSMFLNWCLKRGYVTTNPASKIDRRRVHVSGGANIDINWRTRSRHGGKAAPMARFATGAAGWIRLGFLPGCGPSCGKICRR